MGLANLQAESLHRCAAVVFSFTKSSLDLMKRIAIAAVVVLLAWLLVRPGLQPIGGQWAVGRGHYGAAEALYRGGDHPYFQRTRGAARILEYRFYGPELVTHR